MTGHGCWRVVASSRYFHGAATGSGAGNVGARAAMSGNGNYVVTAVRHGMCSCSIKAVWKPGPGTNGRTGQQCRDCKERFSCCCDGHQRVHFNMGSFRVEQRHAEDRAGKNMALSPPVPDLIVVTTDAGRRDVTPLPTFLWKDNRSDSLDMYIAFTSDGQPSIQPVANGCLRIQKTGH